MGHCGFQGLVDRATCPALSLQVKGLEFVVFAMNQFHFREADCGDDYDIEHCERERKY
jgi:hypothetical protein